MVINKGDYVQYDVVVEKYVTKTVCERDKNGKIIKDENGKNKKQEIDKYTGFQLVPTSFLKEGITLYGPVSNGRNQMIKTRSTVYDKFTQKFYIVKHTIPEIEKSLGRHMYHVGFRVGEVHR